MENNEPKLIRDPDTLKYPDNILLCLYKYWSFSEKNLKNFPFALPREDVIEEFFIWLEKTESSNIYRDNDYKWFKLFIDQYYAVKKKVVNKRLYMILGWDHLNPDKL